MKVTMNEQPLPLLESAQPKEMLSLVAREDGRTLVRINFSSLSIMQECWRKTEYALLRKLRSNLESPATLFGSAIHKGLETYYLGKRTERSLPKNYRDTMALIGAGNWQPDYEESLLFRSARSFVEKCEPLSALPSENKRSRASGVWILTHYFEKYLEDSYVIHSDENGPIVERKFTMPLYEDDTMVIEGFGTIDFVMRNEATDAILPGDHKTTSMLGDAFYKRLHPNFQYSFYTMAAREVLGLESYSFLVNALEVKAPPKTSRGSPPQFARQVTTRTEEDFHELKNAIIEASYQLIVLKQQNLFPMSAPGPCSNYNGCQFLEVCSTPSSLRETVIRAKYSTGGAK